LHRRRIVVFSTSAPERIFAGFRTIVAVPHQCALRRGWHRFGLHL